MQQQENVPHGVQTPVVVDDAGRMVKDRGYGEEGGAPNISTVPYTLPDEDGFVAPIFCFAVLYVRHRHGVGGGGSK